METHRLLHLARAQALDTYILGLGTPFPDDVDPLNIRQPAALGPIIGMADAVANLGSFSTHNTLGHVRSSFTQSSWPSTTKLTTYPFSTGRVNQKNHAKMWRRRGY
jgi:hypothetical protein